MTPEQIENERLRGELRAAAQRAVVAEREVERLTRELTKRADETRHWRKQYAEELERHDETKVELGNFGQLLKIERDGRLKDDARAAAVLKVPTAVFVKLVEVWDSVPDLLEPEGRRQLIDAIRPIVEASR